MAVILVVAMGCGGKRADEPAAAPTTHAPDAGVACASDADCGLHYNGCDELPCTCHAHLRGATKPCAGPPSPARCLVDPCATKAAACREGRCEVYDRPRPSSSM